MKLKLIAMLIVTLSAMASCATQPAPAYSYVHKNTTSSQAQVVERFAGL